MAIHDHKGAAALVLGLLLAGTPALADEGDQKSIGEQQGQSGAMPGQGPQQIQPGFGAGVGATPQCPQCPPGAGAGISGWSPGGYGQQSYGQQGMPGAGIGAPSGQQGVSVPHYWLADAALFTGNAANTANVLSMEHGLNVPAPQVLGNQAQFLVAATNRALNSLLALQQNAEATNPTAVPEIRGAVGHLVAAQAQASQVADSANAGVLGPTFEAGVRSTLGHLAAAEKSIGSIGRAYNAPQFAAAGACATRAFGAGLGPQKGGTFGPGAPKKQQQQQQQQQQPQQQQQQPQQP